MSRLEAACIFLFFFVDNKVLAVAAVLLKLLNYTNKNSYTLGAYQTSAGNSTFYFLILVPWK